MAIPKVIHYCWYGNGPKPDCFEKCYASWKKYAPDYEIMEWNESNTNIQDHPFMRQAYEAKKYAFVSDVARLKILYDYGGIYLDTDVELRQPLDDLLGYSMFFFFNTGDEINTGLGFGAEKMQKTLAVLLADYDTMEFSLDTYKSIACTKVNTANLCRSEPGFEPVNRTQILNNHAYLSSYDYSKFALHLYAFSWKNEDDQKADRFKKKNIRFFGLRRFLRNPKIFDFFREHKLRRLGRIYRLCVYDILDNGLIYYGYRLLQKTRKALRKAK